MSAFLPLEQARLAHMAGTKAKKLAVADPETGEMSVAGWADRV